MREVPFRCPKCSTQINVRMAEFGDTPSPELLADKDIAETFKSWIWTTEPPTQEGWYWVYSEPEIAYGVNRDKLVKQEPETRLYYFNGHIWQFSPDDYEYTPMHEPFFKYWLGPLPLPEPPQEKA